MLSYAGLCHAAPCPSFLICLEDPRPSIPPATCLSRSTPDCPQWLLEPPHILSPRLRMQSTLPNTLLASIFTRLTPGIISQNFISILILPFAQHAPVSQVPKAKCCHQITKSDASMTISDWVLQRAEGQLIWGYLCNSFPFPEYDVLQWFSGRCAYRIRAGYKGSKALTTVSMATPHPPTKGMFHLQ